MDKYDLRGKMDLFTDRLLRVSGAARLLSVSPNKIYKMIKDGQIPVIKIGETIRIPQRALMDALHFSYLEGVGAVISDPSLVRLYFKDADDSWIPASTVRVLDTLQRFGGLAQDAWYGMARNNTALNEVRILAPEEYRNRKSPGALYGSSIEDYVVPELTKTLKEAFKDSGRQEKFSLNVAFEEDILLPNGIVILETAAGERYIRAFWATNTHYDRRNRLHEKDRYALADRDRDLIDPIIERFDSVYAKNAIEGKILEWKWP
ncbi:MAG: helix-turn-helix domain-containing protein [Candidatus Aenigmarchaeota archaeon]|nr:helix-turn-helix domain-containing protein [Candidatus Aenigmarchaeota archaeon]